MIDKRAFWFESIISCTVAAVYLFLYLPISVLVLYSFNSATFPAPWTSFSLKWYKELFNSPHIWYALKTSLIVSSVATLLSILLSLGLIYYQFIEKSSEKHINRMLSLFYGNVVIPDLVVAVGLLSLFAYFSVPLGILTLIVAHTVLGIGFAVPLLSSRFQELDHKIIEASLDLGATRAQTFRKIIIPLLRPAFIASGLLIFILSFDDFILSFFCAGSETQTLSLYIFSAIRSGASPVINALSTLLLVFSSLLVLIFTSLNVRSRIF